MNLLFKVLLTNKSDLFKYLSCEDHKNLCLAFMDKYILYLLDSNSYRKKVNNYDYIIKMVLETINIHSLKSTTLNLLHREFWNHISLNCRLKEKFIYKWSHKINMFRFKLNKHNKNGRQFSAKFLSRFPGIETYKPCSKCFDDTNYHYYSFCIDDQWMCEDCYDKYNSWFDLEPDYPSDRHWSEDDTDYENNNF